MQLEKVVVSTPGGPSREFEFELTDEVRVTCRDANDPDKYIVYILTSEGLIVDATYDSGSSAEETLTFGATHDEMEEYCK